RIQDADARKNEFLAMLAHELRNPLAPMRNALEVMRHKPQMRLQAEETIERQVKEMGHLGGDLMEISSITQGTNDLREEPIQLADALTHAIETVQPLIRQKGHTLTLDMQQESIWLNADSARISQIFSNLLNNSAKYTDNNGSIHVMVRSA